MADKDAGLLDRPAGDAAEETGDAGEALLIPAALFTLSVLSPLLACPVLWPLRSGSTMRLSYPWCATIYLSSLISPRQKPQENYLSFPAAPSLTQYTAQAVSSLFLALSYSFLKSQMLSLLQGSHQTPYSIPKPQLVAPSSVFPRYLHQGWHLYCHFPSHICARHH